MIYPYYLIKGLNASKTHDLNLMNTLATVESVVGNGLFVNIQLDLYKEGQEVLENIPLLKYPYLNIPVRVGDKVYLTKVNHLINNYFMEGEFLEYISQDSYVAIQCNLDVKFKEDEFTNDFILINPERTYKWTLNESSSNIEAEEISETIKFKDSNIEYIENSNVKIGQDYSIKANNMTISAPSIDIGSDNVKLGSLLEQLCQALASSQCIVTSGPSAGSYQSLTKASEISQIGSQIKSVFK